MTSTLIALGNIIGGRSYFGSCWSCGFQFMSTWTMVADTKRGLICAKCHHKGVGR